MRVELVPLYHENTADHRNHQRHSRWDEIGDLAHHRLLLRFVEE